MAAATHITLASAPQPGAIAMLQLQGPAAVDLLVALTGRPDWPPGRMCHVRLGDIDDGCAVCLRGGPQGWVQLLPHGGPRVVQRLTRWLAGRGAKVASRAAARSLYPEADSDLEADLLALLARAASPAAIDLLLAQPAQWRRALRQGYDRSAVLEHSGRLDRLIDPPTIAVVGVPNAGKSTLSNRLRGRQASLVSDLPGTTRDWVSGLVVLYGRGGPRAPAVAVRWVDTPGLARSADPLERRAISLARDVVRGADVVVALREPRGAWPVAGSLARVPDLWVVTKCEGAAPGGDPASAADPLPISAHSGLGLDRLQEAVLARLDLVDLGPPQPWAFSAALRRIVDLGDAARLAAYAAPGDPAAR